MCSYLRLFGDVSIVFNNFLVAIYESFLKGHILVTQGAYYVVVKNSIGQTLFKEKFVWEVSNVRD